MRFPLITGYRASRPQRLALTTGAYQARSLIAEAQRCINLYPEANPPDAPFPSTHYPTPGLALWSSAPANARGPGRGIYKSTRGVLYAVVRNTLYRVDAARNWVALGALDTQLGPVQMIDNGMTLLIVDGPSAEQVARAPVASPTLAPATIPGPLPSLSGYLTPGQVVQLPGLVEYAITIQPGSSNTQVDVLLLAYTSSGGEPYGYLFRFDGNAGAQVGQIYKVQGSSQTLIGTYAIPPNAAAIEPGVQVVTLQVGLAGSLQMWVGGMLVASAADSSYSLSGQVWFGTPNATTSALLSPVKVALPSIYVLDLASNKFARLLQPAIYGATHAGYVDTFFVLNQPLTQNFYITTSNLQYIDSVEGPITELALGNGGGNYLPGSYANVPLTGGTGTGALGTLVVNSSGAVESVSLDDPGQGYTAGDTLSAALQSATGAGGVSSLSLLLQGAGLQPGTYTNVPLTGGAGTGAEATIVIADTLTPPSTFVTVHKAVTDSLSSGGPVSAPIYPSPIYGAVASAVITTPGTGYAQGDVLSCSLPVASTPPGSGWQVAQPTFRASISGAPVGSGLVLTVNQIQAINAINSLNIAAKTGFADLLQGFLIVHRELWLFGKETTEVWVDTGAPDFPFGIEGGIFLQRGLLAPYSLCKSDLTPFWLGQDQNGAVMVFQGVQYNAVPISTPAMANEFQSYARVDDATAFIYQQGLHTFYVLNFPTADRTWVYDLLTEQWHQRATVDSDGTIHRHYPESYARAYNQDIVQRYDTGDLLVYDLNLYSDLGEGVTRIRGFPHIQNELRRVIYNHLVASMAVGAAPATSDMVGSDQGIYPVAATTLVFALINSAAAPVLGAYQRGQPVGLPGSIYFDLNVVPGSQFDLLLLGGTSAGGLPDGYVLRVQSQAGDYPLELFRVDNGVYTSIGTPLGAPNAAALAGLHHFQLTVTAQGVFTGIVDGVEGVSGSDTTYVSALSGDVYFANEVEGGNVIAPQALGTYPLEVSLRWSDDAGETWKTPLPMVLGSGDTMQHLRWSRLGMARDRVFEISWRTSIKTALNGAWVSYIEADS